jgi:Spy/CpxP family protein refolding chaperone
MIAKTKLRGISCTAIWLLICLLLSSASLPAQQPQPQGPDPIAENLFPPDQVLSNQKAIGLDDAQRNFVRSEVLKAQTRFTELQFQLQDAMEALVGLLKQDPVDEAQVMAQLDKVLNAEREVKRTQIALMVRIKNKLKPEQQARLRQLRAKPSGE